MRKTIATFDELDVGEVFRTEDYDNFFMKTEVGYEKFSGSDEMCEINAVSLYSSERESDGLYWHIAGDMEVIVVNDPFNFDL